MKKIEKSTPGFKGVAKLLVAILILWPLGFIIRKIPRDKRLWTFGTFNGNRYADNSRALYEWISASQNDLKIRPMWISKNTNIVKELKSLGLSAEYAYSLRGIYYSMRSGIYIYCYTSSDINYWLSFGAIKINLWHGTPLKKILRDVDNNNDRDWKAYHSHGLARLYYKAIYPGLWENPSLIASTSPTVSTRLSTAFGVPIERVVVTGYPVNDRFFQDPDFSSLPISYSKLPEAYEQGKKIFLYAPTYRERVTKNNPIDYTALNRLCAEYQALFVVKLHPFDKSHLDIEEHSHIIQIPHQADLYSLMSASTALITDYSSIAIDYLLLDKPIIFFTYDLQEYLRQDRGMYEDDFSSVTPGPLCKTPDDLESEIRNILNKKKCLYKKSRDIVLKKYHSITGPCSKSIFNLIESRYVND